MILFFVCILAVIIFLVVIFINLSFRVSILKIDIDYDSNLYLGHYKDIKIKEILKDYKFIIGIYVFNTIPIIKYKVDEARIKKIENSKFLKKISNVDFKKISKGLEERFSNKNITLELIRLLKITIKKIKPDILLFKLYIEVGLNDIYLTTFSILIISSIISILLKFGNIDRKILKKPNQYKYKVIPAYNKTKLKVKFKGIISVKFVHIINILFIFLVNQRRREKNGRTSYRRTYGYSHE